MVGRPKPVARFISIVANLACGTNPCFPTQLTLSSACRQREVGDTSSIGHSFARHSSERNISRSFLRLIRTAIPFAIQLPDRFHLAPSCKLQSRMLIRESTSTVASNVAARFEAVAMFDRERWRFVFPPRFGSARMSGNLLRAISEVANRSLLLVRRL